ncbi:DUF4868 domain-containing protein [Staphylococcus ureilyticus]|uniref:DUF4868 domain-containing protein n=1 Tax=Staphylococcus ureilyticus TaxID=94138 RepID=UPI0021CEFAEE|nr:DUF4868 domain-containing protein [Staphylococcus ureilyticus]UXS60598.1 DUF4868 domain-containing protein [Staphylococcus ureilyticus]
MLRDILENDYDVYLYFIFGKRLDENSTYTNIPITDALLNDIKDICEKYVEEIERFDRVENYNIIGADQSIIESYNLNENLMNIPTIDELFTNTNKLVNINNEELKNYNYFIIDVVLNNEHFYFIRKPFKPNTLKKGKLLSEQRGQFGWINETNLIVFDDKIDMIITNETLFIFNRTSFEHAYNFSEIYDYLSYQVLENQVLKDNIENFEELLIDIGETETLQRRVANLYDKENICLFLEQIEITKKINDNYKLNLTFNGNQIVYEEKAQAKHIVAFMQDAFYETYLGKEQGTDTRR